MAFYVGQKVVCVDASNTPGRVWRAGEAPEIGRTYTVVDVRMAIDPAFGQMLRLAEVERCRSAQELYRAGLAGVWAGYAGRRFRPVVERKTDISALRALLNTTSEKVSA